MPLVKSFFQRIPFIRITSLFLLGIGASHYIQIANFWIGLTLFLHILLLLVFWNNKHFSGVKIQNLLIPPALFLSGMLYAGDVSYHSPVELKKEYFMAEVCQKPIEKPNSYQCVLSVQSARMPRDEKVIAYFKKDGFDDKLIAGDQLILFARRQEITNTGDPFGFDYRTMMRHKGICSSVYLTPGTYLKTGVQINRFTYFAEHVRDNMIALLAAAPIEDEERAIISALTLGYRAELDLETMNYFADTGTIHVLSVSGLHVALIFFILSFIFSRINTGRIGTVIYPMLMLLCLWSYAFITGFSPSVQRSTVMFSFVIIGRILCRPVNIYNSLTASAFALVLLDPNVLFDIGFQLSYLAVFGIVLLQPPLESMLEVKNKILRWAWILLTVSISAQLVTFPLSVFYFNQFPNLFWISNYFVIPGTTFIIWLTIGFFVLSPIPLLSDLLAELLQFVTHQMLIVLKWLSKLPHAVSEGIVFSPLQTWILYALMAACVIYFFSKNKSWIYLGLILLIVFQTSVFVEKCGLFNQKVIYVYQTKGCLIHCINGRDSYILKNDKLPFTGPEIQKIQKVCDHLKLRKPKFIDLQKTTDLKTEDLHLNKGAFTFLNCQIRYADQLIFHIQGVDFVRFKSDNTLLFEKDIIHPGVTTPNMVFTKEGSFIMDFTLNFQRAICIFIN